MTAIKRLTLTLLLGPALLFVTVTLLLSTQASTPPIAYTHEGPLILTGTQVYTIENTTFVQHGHIEVHDQAMLVIRDSTVEFQQGYHEEFGLSFYDSAQLVMEHSTIDSPYSHSMVFIGASQAKINDSDLPQAYMPVAHEATVTITDSWVLHVSPNPAQHGTEPGQVARLNTVGATFHEMSLGVTGEASGTVRSLHPGLLADWTLDEVQDSQIAVHLFNTQVGNIDWVVGGNAHLTFDDCQFWQLAVLDSATLIVHNSQVGQATLEFESGQHIILRGLTSGQTLAHWSLHEADPTTNVPFAYIVENSRVDGWYIRTRGAELTLEDCDLPDSILRPEFDISTSTTYVVRTYLDLLFLWWSHGTVAFENSIVNSVVNPDGSTTRITGTVHFEEKSLVTEWGLWRGQSVITRQFPVQVNDVNGLPLADVPLQLLDSTGGLIWSGQTGADGQAVFDIVFTETNHLDTWTLQVSIGDPPVDAPVQFLSDTPISVTKTSLLEHVAIAGPTTGVVQADYAFTATASPVTATLPITYVWQATGQSAVISTGGLSDTAAFAWDMPGIQAITVTATNRGSMVTNAYFITIYTLVQANFTAAPTSGVAPLAVAFTNTSSGDFTTSLWDFGDGITGTLESPTHTYAAAGVYTVTLTVSGPGGSDTETGYITVYELVQADFTAGPTSGVAPLMVVFTNTSSGDYTTSLWNFGDGITETLGNPTHTYAAAGVYTVTLTVSGPGGTDTLSRTHYITVYEPVQADFTAWPTSGVAPLMVAFTNTSRGDYTASLWDFGDGITGTLEIPTHTYAAAGVYTVTLTVSGLGGTDTLSRTHYITVYEPVEAGFTAGPTSGVAPLMMVFTNTSSGDYTASLWDFGDGITGTLESPSHTYAAAGVYTVTLTVSGLGGTDTLTRTNFITVYEPVQSDFAAWPVSGVAPLTVVFTNASSGDYTTSLWDFGDGIAGTLGSPTHTYVAAGVYTVTLTVSGLGGSDIETKAECITVKHTAYLPLVVRASGGGVAKALPLPPRSLHWWRRGHYGGPPGE